MSESDEFEEKKPSHRLPPSREDAVKPTRRSRSEDEDEDDLPRRRRRIRRDDDDEDDDRGDEAVSTIIPYKNPNALAAYYCGVFSLIPCVGAILGPIALVLGILGLRYRKTHPRAHGTGHSIAGIILGSLTILFNWGGVAFIVVSILLQKK